MLRQVYVIMHVFDFSQQAVSFCCPFFAIYLEILKAQMNQSYTMARITISLSNGPHREHLNPTGI